MCAWVVNNLPPHLARFPATRNMNFAIFIFTSERCMQPKKSLKEKFIDTGPTSNYDAAALNECSSHSLSL